MELSNWERFRPDGDRSWFLYVGEIKTAGLNRFLVDSLTRRYGKPARCIHVVPDVLAFYPDEVFLVVGPGSEGAGQGSPERENRRLPASRFASMVSADHRVRELVDRILDDQGELLLNVFESSTELTLASDGRVRIIGPDAGLASHLNSKLNQYEMAISLDLPVPEGKVCRDLDEALTYAERILSSGGRVFVSGAYSAGGSNSIVASSIDEIASRFRGGDGGLLVTRYIEHLHDPTVLGVVGGEEDVYVASVADQTIIGTRFMGSTFPTVLDRPTVERLKEITRIVGSHMGMKGYRGTFGCDYIVDAGGEVYFIEINARKQGTTMETTLTMLNRLPGHPTLPELELQAVLEGRLPRGLEEMDSTSGPLCWGTYNYKADRDCLVEKYVPPSMEEEKLFEDAMAGRAGHVVLDHAGPGTHMAAGGFVARIIAAGPTPMNVRKGLEEGARQVLKSIK